MKHVAVVGATGAVGGELLRVLEQRRYPVASLRALASPRSVGSTITFNGSDVVVAEATDSAFDGVDVAFFSAGKTRSRALVPAAIKAGAMVIDNSSAFRMDPDVPLVVPEVNPGALADHQGVVANPNCVAAILTMAMAPLSELATAKRAVVATYQSASGAGARAMEDLVTQTTDYLEGRPVIPRVLKHPFAFNLFSHDSDVEANGYNGEENKVVDEIKKILGAPDLGISVTCVRVPILRAHTMALNLEFDRVVTVEEAREALQSAAGVTVVDDRDANHFPMPNEASGQDDVLVGRLRRDPSCATALNLMISGDQLLKGAALNAIQIAEALDQRGA